MIVNGQSYGVGIMTYSKRKTYVTNLINDIRTQSNIPIYLAVNCDYKKSFDEEYRSFILDLCKEYPSVYPSFYLKFRGCAKIWNDMIINASYDNLIILNDDVRVYNNFIDDLIRYKIDVIRQDEILKVNNGWCGFCVNKNYMKSVGFFNEFYLGIGFEDTEFVHRVKEFPAYVTDDFVSLTNESLQTFPNMETSKEKIYSQYNLRIYHRGIFSGVNYRPYEDIYDRDFDIIF